MAQSITESNIEQIEPLQKQNKHQTEKDEHRTVWLARTYSSLVSVSEQNSASSQSPVQIILDAK